MPYGPLYSALPADGQGGRLILEPQYAQLLANFEVWQAHTNANQFDLNNLNTLNARLAVLVDEAGEDSVGMRLATPNRSTAGVQTGSRLVLKANSFDVQNRSREFVWRPSTTTNAGDGYLALFTRLDAGALTEILRATSGGELQAKLIAIRQDVSGALRLGRTSAGFTGSVIDMRDTDGGVNHPTFLAFQFNSAEKYRFSDAGVLSALIGVTFADGGGGATGRILSHPGGFIEIGTLSNHAVSFMTNSTEKMHLAADGRLGLGAAPNAAALLDLNSTTKGLLLPRMSTAQRDAIAAPPAGLLIYNSTTNKLNVRTSTWEVVTSA